MFSDQANKFKFEKTEPAWSDIVIASYGIIAASMVAFLLTAGLGYYVFR
jgi:hypothetical protein